MPGLFITLEGIEGSGKTTQILQISRRLEAMGYPLVTSKEPGGTSLGKEVRKLLLHRQADGTRWCPESEMLLFYADRMQHLDQVVQPALREGKIVLVDRFEDSTRAYQGTLGITEELLHGFSSLLLEKKRPNLTLLLDMDPSLSLKRVAERNASLGSAFLEERYDHESLKFHQAVRERFLDLAKKEPNRIKVIAGDGDPAVILEHIWGFILEALVLHKMSPK